MIFFYHCLSHVMHFIIFFFFDNFLFLFLCYIRALLALDIICLSHLYNTNVYHHIQRKCVMIVKHIPLRYNQIVFNKSKKILIFFLNQNKCKKNVLCMYNVYTSSNLSDKDTIFQLTYGFLRHRARIRNSLDFGSRMYNQPSTILF